MNISKLIISVIMFINSYAFADVKPLYTIYTASPKSSYQELGLSIRGACPSLNIQVQSTKGSLDNINQLIQEPIFKTGYRFAFVQNDAMAAISASEPKLKKLVKPIMGLYPEDITILVNKESGINTLPDLQGKRVSVGLPGSGSWFSSTLIRGQLGITWTSIERSQEESILDLLTGNLDAAIVVGAHPITLYAILGSSIQSRVKLINLTDTELNVLYSSSILPAFTYKWQTAQIVLRKTNSNLVASLDVPKDAINKLSQCILKNQKMIYPKTPKGARNLKFVSIK
jgi:TRAP transporter TAXI family solute receptor